MKATHLIRNTLLTGVCIGLLTGCSWLDDWPPKGSDMAVKTAPKPAESKIGQTANAGRPGANTEGRQAVVSAPAPKGLAIDDAAASRIAQLEQEVAAIRNQLDMMMPALTKLAEAQGDIQKILTQVEPAAGGAMPPPAGNVAGYGQNQPVQPTPITRQQMPAPAPQQQQAAYQQAYQQPYQQASAPAPAPAPQYPPPAAQQNSGPQPGSVAWYEQQEQQKRQNARPQQARNTYQPAPAPQQQQATYQQASYNGGGAAGAGTVITNVRFGEHPDKTRLVFDTSAQANFSYDIDNTNMILTVSLPNADWQGATQMKVDTSPLVSSYNAVPDGNGGYKVMMQLLQPARVLWAQALQPGGAQGNRVVFDIAPL